MNRLIAAAAAVLAAATATSVMTAVVPALAASHPAVNHAAKAKQTTAHGPAATPHLTRHGPNAKAAALLPVEIASKMEDAKYVTVVDCSGTLPSAPSVHLAKPDAPLTVTGSGSSPRILKALAAPNSYKTVYTCTVTVEMKVAAKKAHPAKQVRKVVAKAHQKKKTCEIAASAGAGHQGAECTKTVTLNTGFGALAPQVTGHHPTG